MNGMKWNELFVIIMFHCWNLLYDAKMLVSLLRRSLLLEMCDDNVDGISSCIHTGTLSSAQIITFLLALSRLIDVTIECHLSFFFFFSCNFAC